MYLTNWKSQSQSTPSLVLPPNSYAAFLDDKFSEKALTQANYSHTHTRTRQKKASKIYRVAVTSAPKLSLRQHSLETSWQRSLIHTFPDTANQTNTLQHERVTSANSQEQPFLKRNSRERDNPENGPESSQTFETLYLERFPRQQDSRAASMPRERGVRQGVGVHCNVALAIVPNHQNEAQTAPPLHASLMVLDTNYWVLRLTAASGERVACPPPPIPFHRL